MSKLRYTPDEDISVHREGAILQLARNFRSHEIGLPEWAKNSADAYVRRQAPPERRVIVLIFDHGRRGHLASISCLDFVGMTSQEIEEYFRVWADPEAAGRGTGIADLQGGHGNGGKSYMTQMFEDYAYLYTVSDGKGYRYGVPGGKFRFGYIPAPEEGRDFPVPDRQTELERVLAEVRVKFQDLPEAARQSFAQSEGFTLVRGVNPKDYGGRIPVPQLIEKIVNYHQMVRTLQVCNIYVVVNGKLFNQGRPLALPDITPMAGAEKPKEIVIPETLRDPVSEESASSTKQGQFPRGKLILRTSEKSMRWRPRKFRHNIQFIAQSGFIGLVEIAELGVESPYKDKIYGECFLDALEEYKKTDRTRLTESPLTRAVNDWIRRQIEAYCREFETRDRRRYGQEERDALSRINAALDRWKNQFLEEMMEGLWGGEGEGVHVPTRESLPVGTPARMMLTASHSKAGVGVSLRPTLKFFDAEGNRIRPIPYRWVSSDNNVAMVDDDLLMINTFSFGATQIHAETLEGKLRSNSIPLEVVHIHDIRIEPQKVEVPAGSRQRFDAVCRLATGEDTADVYLIWDVDNSSIARVSSAGLVYGFEPGETQVYAMDEHCLSRNPATVKVLPALGRGAGDRRGRGYPRVLISEIDPDPETGDPVPFSRETPPVWQRPIDVERNIWWINSASPLARLYLDGRRGYGYNTREWRIYHLERFIEIMAKIRLGLDYRQGEEVSFDYWMGRWDEITAQMQEHAVSSLKDFIYEGHLPGK